MEEVEEFFVLLLCLLLTPSLLITSLNNFEIVEKVIKLILNIKMSNLSIFWKA